MARANLIVVHEAGRVLFMLVLVEPCVCQCQADPDDDEVTLVLPGREQFDDSQPDMGEPFDPLPSEAGQCRSHCANHNPS